MKTVFLGILFFTNALLAQQYTNPMSINLKVGLTHPGSNWPGCNLNATAAGIKLTDLNPAFKPGVSIWLQSAGDFEVEIPNSLNVPYSRHTGFDYVTTQGLKSIVCTNPIDPFLIECIGPRESTLTASVAALTIPENHDYIYLAPYRAYCTVATDVENDYRISGTVRFIDEVIKNITIIQDGIEIPSGPSLISVKLERPLQFKLELTPGMDMLDSELYACRKKINHTFTNSGDGNVYVNVSKLDAFDCEYDPYVQFKLKGNTTSGQNIQVGERIFYFNIFRQLEGDFYQVIKNPILNSPSTIVDLVAGKNADFILKAIPLMDATNAKLEIRDENNSVLISYDATAAKANENGEIFFQLDPVPSTYEFTNKNLTARAYVKSSSNSSERYYEVSREFVIRKTKPIKIKFLKIVSPPGANLYSSPSLGSMALTTSKGLDFINILFPVSDKEFGAEQSIMSLVGTSKIYGIDDDFYKMNLMNDRSVFSINNTDTTHYVALATEEYFFFAHKLIVDGVSIPDVPNFFVQSGEISTLAHELVHAFGVTFDNVRDKLHYPDDHFLSSIMYSNYNSTPLLTNRSFLKDRYHLMLVEDMPNISQENGYWLDDKTYLQLFKNNLYPLERIKINVLNLFGKVKSDLNSVLTGISIFRRVKNNDKQSKKINLQSGYRANIFNYKNELIKTLTLEGKFIVPESENTKNSQLDMYFDQDIEIDNQEVFIDIVKDVEGGTVFVKKIVLPVDLVIDKIKYISDKAFKSDKNTTILKIREILFEVRKEILDGRIEVANSILKTKFYSYIAANLTSNFYKNSPVDLGLLEIQNLLIYSTVKLDALFAKNTKNPFLIFSEMDAPSLGSRSKVKINLINPPLNPEYFMVYDVFFDNLPIQVDVDKDYLIAQSEPLNVGIHNWLIRTSIVNKKIWKQYEDTIKALKLRIYDLQEKLKVETSLFQREVISDNLRKAQQQIDFLETKKNELKKEVGVPFNFELEVMI